VIEADEGAELTLRTSVATGSITAVWDKKYRKAIRGVPPKVHIGERAWLTERVAGHDLRVSAGSFFQSGAQAAELLVAAVKRANESLARVETIKKIHILDREFSVQEDELTPTLKMKRKNIETKFAETFDRLYDDEAFGLVVLSE